jgi:hypothetical protein
MRRAIVHELMRFALTQGTVRERLRYMILGLVYYHFLAATISEESAINDSASGSQAGDDIYPLF